MRYPQALLALLLASPASGATLPVYAQIGPFTASLSTQDSGTGFYPPIYPYPYQDRSVSAPISWNAYAAGSVDTQTLLLTLDAAAASQPGGALVLDSGPFDLPDYEVDPPGFELPYTVQGLEGVSYTASWEWGELGLTPLTTSSALSPSLETRILFQPLALGRIHVDYQSERFSSGWLYVYPELEVGCDAAPVALCLSRLNLHTSPSYGGMFGTLGQEIAAGELGTVRAWFGAGLNALPMPEPSPAWLVLGGFAYAWVRRNWKSRETAPYGSTISK